MSEFEIILALLAVFGIGMLLGMFIMSKAMARPVFNHAPKLEIAPEPLASKIHREQDPSMEEILASIRRIISEDDAPREAVTFEPSRMDLLEERIRVIENRMNGVV